MKQKLTIEKFLDFQEQLQKEILSLEVIFFIDLSAKNKNRRYEPIFSTISNKKCEFHRQFERRNPDSNGNISEVDFTELLLAYAGYPEKKKAKMLKRVKKRYFQFHFIDFFLSIFSSAPSSFVLVNCLNICATQFQGSRQRYKQGRLSQVLPLSQQY